MAVKNYKSVQEGTWKATSAQNLIPFSGYDPNSCNVLFYMDSESASYIGKKNVKDSTCHLIDHFSKNNDCSVCVSSSKVPELCEDANYVFTRFDPPLDFSFSKELEKYDNGERVFFNPPKAQQLISNKSYLKDFSGMGILPDTYIGKDQEKIFDFINRNGDVVIKSLSGYGGSGIERLRAEDYSKNSLMDKISSLEDNPPLIFQKFISKISEYGDKRIWLLYGEPIGSILRLPKDGGFLCNIHQGGKYAASDLTKQDYSLIEKIAPWIKDNRMNLVGIDVIGPYLGEINGISPGCLYSIDNFKKNSSREESSANKILENVLEGYHEN